MYLLDTENQGREKTLNRDFRRRSFFSEKLVGRALWHSQALSVQLLT